MRVERVYDWKAGQGFMELDPNRVDLSVVSPKSIRLAHLSDTHLGKEGGAHRRRELRRWLELFDGVEARVVVHSGDLVERADDEEELQAAMALLEKSRSSILGVPGNHDVERPGQASELVRRWGPFPRREEVAGVRFWLLNSMVSPPVGERDEGEVEAARESGFFSRGGLGAEQLDELEQGLGEPWEGPQVVVLHHHLYEMVPAKPWYAENSELMGPLGDRRRLLDVVVSGGVDLVLHGHRHQYTIPYSPMSKMVIVNAGSSTPSSPPFRARVIDMHQGGGAMRIWELVRYG